MLNLFYCKEFIHLFSQHYNINGAKCMDDLNERDQEQIAIVALDENTSPFDSAELLLLPSDQNKDTIVTILKAHYSGIIDADETVRRIIEKVIATTKDDLDKVFEEMIEFERLEYSSSEAIAARKADAEYELYAQQQCFVNSI